MPLRVKKVTSNNQFSFVIRKVLLKKEAISVMIDISCLKDLIPLLPPEENH